MGLLMTEMVVSVQMVMRLRKEGKQSESWDACLVLHGGYDLRTQWVICMLCRCVRESKDIESDFVLPFFLFLPLVGNQLLKFRGDVQFFYFVIRNVYIHVFT